MLFFLCCVQAFLLNYATFLCTKINSALTTSVTGSCVWRLRCSWCQIGQVKNIVVTIGGMFFNDFIWHSCNVFGLAMGLVGSIWYTRAKMEKTPPDPSQKNSV